MFAELSKNACEILGLETTYGHLDSTSFHLDGKYNSESTDMEDLEAIHITQGYSRDHRSELPQVILNLINDLRH